MLEWIARLIYETQRGGSCILTLQQGNQHGPKRDQRQQQACNRISDSIHLATP